MSAEFRGRRGTLLSVATVATTAVTPKEAASPPTSPQGDNNRLARRAARFGKERKVAASSPGGTTGGAGGGRDADGGDSGSEISAPRTFQVATERGGKRLMSEDEVSSLVHSALLRARQATSSFSPRARSSRPFGAEASPGSSVSGAPSGSASASPAKAAYSAGSGGGGSRPPTSAASSPRKAALAVSGLYVPRDDEMKAPNGSSLARTSPRAANSSFHTARTSARWGTPRARGGGGDSVGSFEGFLTPDQSDVAAVDVVVDDDDHPQLSHPHIGSLDLDLGSSHLGSANLSMTSTDEGMEVESAVSLTSPSAGSVNSSEAIIRRVEEEIANARMAAKEANMRLAGVSANLKEAGRPHGGGDGAANPEKEKRGTAAAGPTKGGAADGPHALSPMALLALDDEDGSTDALFDSALNVIGEEFDTSESDEAGREEDEQDDDGVSDDATSPEDRKWLAEMITDGSLETSFGGPDQMRLITSQSYTISSSGPSFGPSFEAPYSPNAPDDERGPVKPGTGEDVVAPSTPVSTPFHDITGRVPAFDDKDIVMSPTEEIESLLREYDSFGEGSSPGDKSAASTAAPQRIRSIDIDAVASDDILRAESEQDDERIPDEESLEEHEEEEVVATMEESAPDGGQPETNDKESGNNMEPQEMPKSTASDDSDGNSKWLMIDDDMEEKKSDDSLHLRLSPCDDGPARLEGALAQLEEAPLDELRSETESPVLADPASVEVAATPPGDDLDHLAGPRMVEADDSPVEDAEGDQSSGLSSDDSESPNLTDDCAEPVEHPVPIDEGAVSDADIPADEEETAMGCNNEAGIAADALQLEPEWTHDSNSWESANHEGAPDDEVDERNNDLDLTSGDESKCDGSETGLQSLPRSGICIDDETSVTQARQVHEDESTEQGVNEGGVRGDLKEMDDSKDRSQPQVDDDGDEIPGGPDEDLAHSGPSYEKFDSESDDRQKEDLEESHREDPAGSSVFIYQVVSAGSTDAVATDRVPLPNEDSEDESHGCESTANEASTSQLVPPDQIDESIEIHADALQHDAKLEKSDEYAKINESTSEVADTRPVDDTDGIGIQEKEDDGAFVVNGLHEQQKQEYDDLQESGPTLAACVESSTKDYKKETERRIGEDAPLERSTGSAAGDGYHDSKTEVCGIAAESVFDGLEGETNNELDRDGEEQANRGDDQTTVFVNNTRDEPNHITDACDREIQESVTPLARSLTVQIPSPIHSGSPVQTQFVASSPRRSASPVPNSRRVALVDNRRALQARADAARKAMRGESSGPTGLPGPAKDIPNKARKVKFKQRYPVPPPVKRPRHPAEIVMDYRTESSKDKLFYSKPKKDLKELLEAVTGSSIPRRSNACGALKVLSTQKKNKLTLVRTIGFLDALVFAISDNFSMDDAEAGLAARTRAVNVVVNVAEMKDSRYHIFTHNGMADSLVKCMMEDKGEGRASACAALAMLAKTPQCREPMANTEKLVDVLATILKGDEPSMFHRDGQSSRREKKKVYSDDDDASQTFCSSSSSDNSSARNESTLSHDLESMNRARMNACAALLHLSKECSVSQLLCGSSNLLYCLLAASKEFDHAMHTKVLEIICNLTRFPHNNAIVVKYPGLVDSLIANGKLKNDDDRVWAIRTLQNLSTDTAARTILANKTILELLSVSMMRSHQEEQRAATTAMYNLSTEPGAVVPLTNTKNVVATLVHVAHSPTSSYDVRLMACDTLATLGLWLQTLSGAGTVPDDVEPVALPTYITSGWNRWEA